MPKRRSRDGRVTAPVDAKEKQRLVRRVAAAVRGGKRQRADASVVRLVDSHLRHRATYNARRRLVRELAAEIKAGRRPKVPAGYADSVRKHLEYRAWYNEQRRLSRKRARQAVRGRSMPGRQPRDSAASLLP